MAMGGGGKFPIVPPGIWVDARGRPLSKPRAGLFLDRDGVVVVDKGFLRSSDDIELVPGAGELIAEANRCALPTVVVTNQSGIARGLFDWARFADVEAEIERCLGVVGARLDAVLACPFHPDFTADFGATQSHWRKPGPGLLLAAARILNIDIEKSWLIGDRRRDIEAARNAGLAGAILLRGTTAGAPRSAERTDPRIRFHDLVAADVPESLSILKDVGLLAGSG